MKICCIHNLSYAARRKTDHRRPDKPDDEARPTVCRRKPFQTQGNLWQRSVKDRGRQRRDCRPVGCALLSQRQPRRTAHVRGAGSANVAIEPPGCLPASRGRPCTPYVLDADLPHRIATPAAEPHGTLSTTHVQRLLSRVRYGNETDPSAGWPRLGGARNWLRKCCACFRPRTARGSAGPALKHRIAPHCMGRGRNKHGAGKHCYQRS